jgi:NAD-dependent dihydropyrimidine dehydrogenase PreA subunit
MFIQVDLFPPADGVTSLVELCPVNIFALRGNRVVVRDEQQDECTLCRLCLMVAPPNTIHIRKLYSDEVLTLADDPASALYRAVR